MARPPEICPNCGAEVPPNARACPECGSDEETGWSDKAREQELGLPDDEFNYEQFIKDEFGGDRKDLKPRRISWLWWGVAVLLLVIFFWWIKKL